MAGVAGKAFTGLTGLAVAKVRPLTLYLPESQDVTLNNFIALG